MQENKPTEVNEVGNLGDSKPPMFSSPTPVNEYKSGSADDNLANRILGLAIYFSQMVDHFSDTVTNHRPTAALHSQIMITLGTFGSSLGLFENKEHEFLTNRLPLVYENILQKLSIALKTACTLDPTAKESDITHITTSSAFTEPIIQLATPLLAEITGDMVNSIADAVDGLVRASWITISKSSSANIPSVLLASRLDRALVLLVAAERLSDGLLKLPSSQRLLLSEELEKDGMMYGILRSYRDKMGSTSTSPTKPFQVVGTDLLNKLQFLKESDQVIKEKTGVQCDQENE